jgi:Tfp pilus assembly protein PilO
MTALRPRDRLALAVVAGVLVIVGIYFLVLNPQMSKVSDLNSQIALQKATLNRDQMTYQEGRAAQISLRTNRREYAAVRRAVPVTADIPGLLRLLQNKSNAAKVRLQSVSMSGNGGAGESQTADTSTGPTAESEVPESLVFSGSYQAIEQLARQLDHLVVLDGDNGIRASGPLVTIGSVSLAGGSRVAATLTASIYEQSPASTASTPTTAETTP